MLAKILAQQPAYSALWIDEEAEVRKDAAATASLRLAPRILMEIPYDSCRSHEYCSQLTGLLCA
jgi:hypothetical protein